MSAPSSIETSGSEKLTPPLLVMFLSRLSGLGGWSAHAQCAQIPRSVRLEKRRGVEREGERGGEQLQKEKDKMDKMDTNIACR